MPAMQEIIPQIEKAQKEKKFKKTSQKFKIFLPVVSFHVFQHPQAFPITLCLPPSVPPVPYCAPFLRCPPQEATSQDLEGHTFENSLHHDNFRKTIKEYMKSLLKGAVHENYINSFFNKKILFGANGPFQAQNWHILLLWIHYNSP